MLPLNTCTTSKMLKDITKRNRFLVTDFKKFLDIDFYKNRCLKNYSFKRHRFLRKPILKKKHLDIGFYKNRCLKFCIEKTMVFIKTDIKNKRLDIGFYKNRCAFKSKI